MRVAGVDGTSLSAGVRLYWHLRSCARELGGCVGPGDDYLLVESLPGNCRYLFPMFSYVLLPFAAAVPRVMGKDACVCLPVYQDFYREL